MLRLLATAMGLLTQGYHTCEDHIHQERPDLQSDLQSDPTLWETHGHTEGLDRDPVCILECDVG